MKQLTRIMLLLCAVACICLPSCTKDKLHPPNEVTTIEAAPPELQTGWSQVTADSIARILAIVLDLGNPHTISITKAPCPTCMLRGATACGYGQVIGRNIKLAAVDGMAGGTMDVNFIYGTNGVSSLGLHPVGVHQWDFDQGVTSGGTTYDVDNYGYSGYTTCYMTYDFKFTHYTNRVYLNWTFNPSTCQFNYKFVSDPPAKPGVKPAPTD